MKLDLMKPERIFRRHVEAAVEVFCKLFGPRYVIELALRHDDSVPDMLEALREVHMFGVTPKSARLVRAAIAKAEGS